MQRYAAPANRPVVGVDDAGVGAIAGPVFAAAVLLPTNWQPSMAAVDSKTLSLEARHAAFKAVCATPGLVWATAAVCARQIDTMGGHPATALAMEQAVAKLEAKLRRRQFGLDSCPAPDRSLSQAPRIFCLVDGPTLPVGLEGVALPGGDRTEAAIAAANKIVLSAIQSASDDGISAADILQRLRHDLHENGSDYTPTLEATPAQAAWSRRYLVASGRPAENPEANSKTDTITAPLRWPNQSRTALYTVPSATNSIEDAIWIPGKEPLTVFRAARDGKMNYVRTGNGLFGWVKTNALD